MNYRKYIPHLFIVTLAIILTISCANSYNGQSDEKEKTTIQKKSKEDYTINNTWKMPEILNEVSGISWISENTIACVEDEDGIIFIYDLKKEKVIQEIAFAGGGDYEGIVINDKDAYVMRSDGLIYEVLRFRESEPEITTFQTAFTARNNIETLTLDAEKNSLVVTPKDRDQSDDFKGLYYITLDAKMMNEKPLLRIDMNDKAFKDYKKKKAYRTFSPSDVAIHPVTGDYYVLEGKNPKLAILDSDGTVKKVYKLNKDDFAQPEGITFSPDGKLFISNEARKDEATIVEVVFEIKKDSLVN
ncbi:SdiA-regulated domain-containing protein [uncultured Dokdonia sp.]|uniref:SdiA-regulated domain-containing protein n=1 Tax=uncultured Dokdonia sp. TaxID=575653 RepID=UPI0026230A0E|nr:SdiA-regulated domain-containing protein [uncultured Dokdonia sp.]